MRHGRFRTIEGERPDEDPDDDEEYGELPDDGAAEPEDRKGGQRGEIPRGELHDERGS